MVPFAVSVLHVLARHVHCVLPALLVTVLSTYLIWTVFYPWVSWLKWRSLLCNSIFHIRQMCCSRPLKKLFWLGVLQLHRRKHPRQRLGHINMKSMPLPQSTLGRNSSPHVSSSHERMVGWELTIWDIRRMNLVRFLRSSRTRLWFSMNLTRALSFIDAYL